MEQTVVSPTYVVDTTRSPHTRLQSVPLAAVRLSDSFWEPRRRKNREITLPSQYQRCEETGRLDNFRRAAGRKDGPFQGVFFDDSDVYKWLEAVAWTLATAPDPELSALVDSVIAEIAAAQQPDGYLNTYFMFDKAAERWTNFDLHEMYCAGHLFQAAVAHYRATGKTTLLDIATRLADHICDTFGPTEQGKRLGVDGHPEIEMALVELYRATGNRRYLEQAQFFVDIRGRGIVRTPPNTKWNDAYYQDHKPLRELDRLYGHAVRAVYLNAGAADLYAETGEAALLQALERMWRHMVSRQMYVSGGIGSRYEGEAFGKDFELPNTRAYTETCAAIGSVMWSWRMLTLSGEARYADLIETTLYNGILPGLALEGQTYFYQNPLADDGSHRRQPWFRVACCPPNLARFLATLPGYFYSIEADAVWVHLYGESQAQLTLADGRTVSISQQTRYPWDGDVTLSVDAAGEYRLLLRIPGWCDEGARLEINGRPFEGALTPGSYVELNCVWTAGDTLRLYLPMAVRQIESHPYVTENAGRVALMRGPLLYCVEQADHQQADVRDLALPLAASLTATFEPDLLGGVVVLRGQAEVRAPGEEWQERLYRPAGAAQQATHNSISLTAIPYYAWANREPGPMQVWLPLAG